MSTPIQPVLTNTTKKFIPSPARAGIALCLSGGGYRAALFHSGAVRRLHELGALNRVDDVSSVSGGSIFAAFLALRLRALPGGQIGDYENDIAAPFRRFTKIDIRTTSALRKLLPWEWMNSAAQSEGLQAEYEKHLTPGKKLTDLPPQPKFHFCSTDLTFGVNWTFTRDKVGDYQAGSMNPADSGKIPLAQAVAASSCFPPVFKPMPLNLKPADLPILGKVPNGEDRDACIRSIALTDGGVYDNMGVEPVWKSCQTLLVCDGGKPFRFAKNSDTPHQLLRLNDVMGDQAEAVRKRWLIASFTQQVYGGAYWGIASAVSKYEVPNAIGYSEALADQIISTIRTDMDKFSDDEAAVLENHGYCLADVAILKYVPQLHNAAPLNAPHPALWPDAANRDAVELRIRTLLADSSHIHIFGH
jgi:NTE family protein